MQKVSVEMIQREYRRYLLNELTFKEYACIHRELSKEVEMKFDWESGRGKK